MPDLPDLGPRGEGWVAIQLALLAVIAIAGPLTGALGGGALGGPLGIVATLAGVALLGAGGALAVRGIIDLRDALTPLPHPRDDAQLVEDGVYARARHPIYGGLIIGAIGWSVLWLSPTTLLLAGGLAVFFRLKSAREERWLIERFPGYAAYRQRTHRFLPLP
jgi:protein-S-isoprenylcysteine O-methyltransferase Ste14